MYTYHKFYRQTMNFIKWIDSNDHYSSILKDEMLQAENNAKSLIELNGCISCGSDIGYREWEERLYDELEETI